VKQVSVKTNASALALPDKPKQKSLAPGSLALHTPQDLSAVAASSLYIVAVEIISLP
jgi:hypothetical protein